MAKVTDFATELSERYGLSAEDAEAFITAMFDVVCRQLATADRQVKVKGLGTFKLTSVGARASVDVNTGQRIILEGRNKVTFTPEALLRDRVNKPFVQFETVVLNDGVDFSEIDREFANEHGVQEEDNAEDADEKDTADDVDGDGKATDFVRDDDSADSDDESEVAEPAFDESAGSNDESETVEPAYDESAGSNDGPETVEPAAEESAGSNDGSETAEPVDSNDGPETVEPAAEESVGIDDEPKTAESVVGDETASNAEGQEPDNVTLNGNPVESLNEKPAETGSLKVDVETLSARSAASPLKEPMVCKQRHPRLMYWLTTASFLLLVCIGIGMYLLYQQMEAKNQAIEQLQSKLAIQSATAEKVKVDNTSRTVNGGKPAAEHGSNVSTDVNGDIQAKTAANAENVGVGKSTGPNVSAVSAQKSKMGSVSDKTKVKADDKKEKKSTSDKVSDKVRKTSDADTPIHSSDVRLRTGAYVIVGTEKIVTVRKGQTLASISKANFGPGMECYVEAYNNCKTVKPGDKLKIPKLKLKKLQRK